MMIIACKMHASERGGGVFLLRHVNTRHHILITGLPLLAGLFVSGPPWLLSRESKGNWRMIREV